MYLNDIKFILQVQTVKEYSIELNHLRANKVKAEEVQILNFVVIPLKMFFYHKPENVA